MSLFPVTHWGVLDELPENFRVLQIVAYGNLGQRSKIEHCISYYSDGIFAKFAACFVEPVKEYGGELLRHFFH